MLLPIWVNIYLIPPQITGLKEKPPLHFIHFAGFFNPAIFLPGVFFRDHSITEMNHGARNPRKRDEKIGEQVFIVAVITPGRGIRSKKEGNLRCKAYRAWRLAKTNIAMPSAPGAMLKNQLI